MKNLMVVVAGIIFAATAHADSVTYLKFKIGQKNFVDSSEKLRTKRFKISLKRTNSIDGSYEDSRKIKCSTNVPDLFPADPLKNEGVSDSYSCVIGGNTYSLSSNTQSAMKIAELVYGYKWRSDTRAEYNGKDVYQIVSSTDVFHIKIPRPGYRSYTAPRPTYSCMISIAEGRSVAEANLKCDELNPFNKDGVISNVFELKKIPVRIVKGDFSYTKEATDNCSTVSYDDELENKCTLLAVQGYNAMDYLKCRCVYGVPNYILQYNKSEYGFAIYDKKQAGIVVDALKKIPYFSNLPELKNLNVPYAFIFDNFLRRGKIKPRKNGSFVLVPAGSDEISKSKRVTLDFFDLKHKHRSGEF